MPYKKHTMSLSKAGRVRAMTPKVDAANKKKKKRVPIGRAKKRSMFARRIGNVNANKKSHNASPYRVVHGKTNGN